MKAIFKVGIFLLSLLLSGCDRRTFSEDALVTAVKEGDTNSIRRAIYKGRIDVNRLIPYDSKGYIKVPIVDVAIESANLPVTEYLLKNGADPNQRDERGMTPLSWAIGRISNNASEKTQIALIDLILEHGANPNLRDKSEYAYTPLILATLCKQKGVVETLLKHGANVNLATFNGETAMHHAEDPEIAALLMKAGADVSIKTKQGKTPWDIAFEKKNTQVMNVITNQPKSGR